jgi:hypothetical protein
MLEKVEMFSRRFLVTVHGLLGQMGVAICVERSSKQAQAALMEEDVPVEDLWFQLLHTQIGTVQAVSAAPLPPLPLPQNITITTMMRPRHTVH